MYIVTSHKIIRKTRLSDWDVHCRGHKVEQRNVMCNFTNKEAKSSFIYCIYTPVLSGCEHLRRALIGRVVRLGILGDVATIRGFLGVWRVFSAVR